METLWQICSAVGLATAAGLNAFIPLIVVAVLVNGGTMTVRPGFQMLGDRWVVVVLMALLVVEMVVDKIAAWNRSNDRVQIVARAASGGILFAAVVVDGNAGAWAVAGIFCALLVHGCKVKGRRAVNLQSSRVGTPVVSVVEDLVSMVVTMVSLLVPAMGVLMVAVFAWILYKMHVRFFGKGRRVVRVRAVAVNVG